MFGFILMQIFSGYELHPPVWYYYPALILLTIATAKVQFNFTDLANFYSLQLESKNEQ